MSSGYTLAATLLSSFDVLALILMLLQSIQSLTPQAVHRPLQPIECNLHHSPASLIISQSHKLSYLLLQSSHHCYTHLLFAAVSPLLSVFCLPPLPPLASGIAVTGDLCRPQILKHPKEKPADQQRWHEPVSPCSVHPLRRSKCALPSRDLMLAPHPLTDQKEKRRSEDQKPQDHIGLVRETGLISSTWTGNTYLPTISKLHQK